MPAAMPATGSDGELQRKENHQGHLQRADQDHHGQVYGDAPAGKPSYVSVRGPHQPQDRWRPSVFVHGFVRSLRRRYHTTVWCGLPSALMVAMTAKRGSSRKWRAPGGGVLGKGAPRLWHGGGGGRGGALFGGGSGGRRKLGKKKKERDTGAVHK